jgi:coniferyl-aldehyde dehydrogenase
MDPRDQVFASMRDVLERQRTAFLSDMSPPLAVRRDRLTRLLRMTEAHADEIARAISEDFGHRSMHETRLADILLIIGGVKHARRSLAKWMRPRRMRTALHFQPGSSRLIRQPLGVVGVVAPWNYPYQLTMGPTISAVAAGNRVMIKPSEVTARFSALLKRIVAEFFDETEMAVVTGDAEVGKAFCALPFDHLVFTGSTAVGRLVAESAARNLTPVTLELGGKSPAIIDPDCDIDVVAPRLAMGKLLNAGQTCIAPDYVLVPAGMENRFVDAMRRAVSKLYPTLADNPDYSSIVSQHHYDRLSGLIADARAKGARVVELKAEGERLGDARKLAPTLLLGVDDEMRVLQEEIFGPVLPVIGYRDLDEAIRYVNRRDRPLALYWLGKNKRNRDKVLAQTISGGVTINDCIWHFGQESLPFGGVGTSGMGACHGEWGFRALSKEKPVFIQSRHNALPLLHPPYGKTFDLIFRALKKIV